jgi:glycine hydroxymethyltransferase
VDQAEELARERAKKVFGAEHANLQPHSGSQANMAAYFALLEPGDTILGMDLSHGGHLTHGSPVNFSGQLYRVVPYGVRESDQRMDFDSLARLAREERPAMIIAGASAYPRTLPFEPFAEVAAECGAYLHADVVTTTTHKTLCGPRGGMILCKAEHAQVIDTALFPGMQGGPLMHSIAAKAVALSEVMRDDFRAYSERIIENSRALAVALQDRGYDLVGDGTDTHLVLVDLRNTELTGKDAEELLGRAAIHVNKNTVPFETRSPFVASGIRLGTPALTTRGMGTDEMRTIAEWMDLVLRSGGQEATIEAVRADVRELCQVFPLYPDLPRGRSAAGWPKDGPRQLREGAPVS